MSSHKGVQSPTSIIRKINDKKEKVGLFKQGGMVTKCKPTKIIRNGKR